MYDRIFGNAFDFNHDGEMDSFERMAEYHAIMNEVMISEGKGTSLDDLSFDELNEIASMTGIDPSISGF